MGEIGKKVIEKIREEKISPKPRWRFLMKNYFVWTLFVVSIVIGALAFCAMLSVLFNNDWDLYKYLHTSAIGHIMLSIPYLWILFLILFTALAFYNYKHTKDGYRHETYAILLLSIAGSVFLGAFLHTLGAGEKIENLAISTVPLYGKAACCSQRKDIWNQPTLGLLGGKIIGIKDERNFDLEDFRGTVWQVVADNEIIGRELVIIRIGKIVKVIGEKKEGRIFWAREIRPWKKGMDL